ncbi:MAG: hypothetical protein JWQ35_2126 [Bacteriovoracaceae bacterium]|nr:hypothetical protein [Bacteriovoracaceae bacterium]
MNTKIFLKLKTAIIFMMLGLTGCATHTREIVIGALVGSAVGAGLGYTVVHSGDHRQYVIPNTITTSVLFGLATAGVLAWHYHSLDEQKVEITSKFSRNWMIEQEQARKLSGPSESTIFSDEVYPTASTIGKYSLRLDENTRWIYPTFRKRYLPPENSGTQLLSARYTWEILKPGTFITREQDPSYFFDNSKSETLPPAKIVTPEEGQKNKQQKQ